MTDETLERGLEMVPFGNLFPRVPGLEEEGRDWEEALLLQLWHGVFLQVFASPDGERNERGFMERFEMVFERHRGLLPRAEGEAARRLEQRLPGLRTEWLWLVENPRLCPTFEVATLRKTMVHFVRRCSFLSIDSLSGEEGQHSSFRSKLALLLARLARNGFWMEGECPSSANVEGFSTPSAVAIFVEASSSFTHSCRPNCGYVCRNGVLTLCPFPSTREQDPLTVNFASHLAEEDALDFRRVWEAARSKNVLFSEAPPALQPTERHRRGLRLRDLPCDCPLASPPALSYEVGRLAKACRNQIASSCGRCDKQTENGSLPAKSARPTFRCGACKIQLYCDRACQVADWPDHKPLCGSMESLLGPESMCRAVRRCLRQENDVVVPS